MKKAEARQEVIKYVLRSCEIDVTRSYYRDNMSAWYRKKS